MPPAIIRDDNDGTEEASSIGSFDHLDSSTLSMVSVTAAVVAPAHAGTTPGAAYGRGAAGNSHNTSARNTDGALPVDSSTSGAANGSGNNNNIDQPSLLNPTQRRRGWYVIGALLAAALFATGFMRPEREVQLGREMQLEMEVQSLRLELDLLRGQLDNATRDRQTLWAELGVYKSICADQHGQLDKLRDDLVDATMTLRALQTNISEYTSRRIGSDTLNMELEPVPRLLMRDIWDEQERNVVIALSKLLTSREPDCNISSNYFPWAHVIMVMARWKHSAVVQYYGCQILGQLPTSARKHAAAFGALDVILKAMKSFPGDVQLQHHALFSLHHLCANHNGNMMRLVERLSGLPIVLASLQSFPESRLTQYWGCRLLEALSGKNQFVGAIRQAGGLAVLSNIYVMWHDGSTDIERAVMEIARSSLAALIRRHGGV